MSSHSIKLRRGFKTECENLALQYRKLLQLKHTDAIDSFELADHLGIRCIPHTDICQNNPDLECLNCSEWSGLLLKEADKAIIVYNASHSKARTASSIMHELGHLILGHSADPLFGSFPLFQRNCTPLQEAEANCFSYTILLPRPMIVSYAMRNIRVKQIAEETGLSEKLVSYRINMSGVLVQYKQWKPFE